MIIFYEGTFVQIKGFQHSFILAENFKIIPIFIIHFDTLYNGELHSTIIKPSNKYWHLILCLANSLTFPISCDLDQIDWAVRMTTECPICLEICDQMKKLQKKLPPQPPHLVCVNCYNKLKLRASTPFAKIPCLICRQTIHVINMTEYDVCNICKQLVLSRNKRKGEHMIVEKCKNICPICFSKIGLMNFGHKFL